MLLLRRLVQNSTHGRVRLYVDGVDPGVVEGQSGNATPALMYLLW
jgi:hypothetical protein